MLAEEFFAASVAVDDNQWLEFQVEAEVQALVAMLFGEEERLNFMDDGGRRAAADP